MRAIKRVTEPPKVDVQSEVEKYTNANIKTEVEKYLSTTEVAGKGKISQILADIKAGKIGDQLDCPGCKSGDHSHKLEKKGNTLKCSGPDCGKEFLVVPAELAPYECESCHTLHIAPADKKARETDKCLTCGGETFVEKATKPVQHVH